MHRLRHDGRAYFGRIGYPAGSHPRWREIQDERPRDLSQDPLFYGALQRDYFGHPWPSPLRGRRFATLQTAPGDLLDRFARNESGRTECAQRAQTTDGLQQPYGFKSRWDMSRTSAPELEPEFFYGAPKATRCLGCTSECIQRLADRSYWLPAWVLE
jgi:hypothetical protein